MKRLHRHIRRGKNIIYLDESGFRKSCCRTYGYAPKGSRCRASYDWQGRNQTNVIGALWGTKLFAAGLFDFSINRRIFDAWVKEVLIPEMPPESVVVMDNASFHKGEALQLLKDCGHEVLWLPPYSPDLNPIEHKWAWIKGMRRKSGMEDIDLLFRTCIDY